MIVWAHGTARAYSLKDYSSMTNIVVYLNSDKKGTIIFYADFLSYRVKSNWVFPHEDKLDNVTMSKDRESDFTVIPKGLLIYG